MRKRVAAGCFAALGVAMLGAGVPRAASGLVVHEWGTILAMNGSDGITLDGMYHEEHALPGFVHSRTREQLRMRSSNAKFETPVIYFYSDEPMQVQVEVGFPSGFWTHWYPQAQFVGPRLVQFDSPLRARDGRIGWTVDLSPSAHGELSVPPASPDALWNYTRDVDAAFVSAADGTRAAKPAESERFIFYRGLGASRLPVNVRADGGGRIACGQDAPVEVRHIYVLRVEDGKGAFRYLPSLKCGQTVDGIVPGMDSAKAVNRFADEVADHLASRLVESGLYAKEARAMVNTWRTSYFETDGVRVLFVLPQSWTDGFIPMRISPAPQELVRVMVGRIELLTPERERAAERAISELASPDAQVRERAFAFLRREGRYVEPIVRRTLQTTVDEQVRTLARRLLLTDFVSEIRAAVNDPADGRPLVQEPVHVRAQLASLLREIGLIEEAKAEGERALAALERMPQPSMTDHQSRNTFRAMARASEAVGNAAAALEWYSEFVEFGSGFAARGCTGCHQFGGPLNASFFRTWYAGRKFGELARKTSEAQRLTAAEEAVLARTDSFLAKLRLAYLYEAAGDREKAERLWHQIDPPAERRAASTP